jgi:tetratricopeptide (TPR) repeat protein
MGTLCQGTVPALLGGLYTGRRSGVLHFTQGREQRSVRLRQGQIVNAHTNVEGDRLGEILVRQGVLSRADLEDALAIVARDGKRIGAALRELGLLDARRLDEALAVHVRQVLGKVFAWSDGAYGFEEQPPGEARAEGEAPLSPFTPEIILEAARSIDDPDVVRYALGDIDNVLVHGLDPLAQFPSLRLSATDGYVLSRVDGVLTAREILSLIPLPPEETQRSLLGLLATGIVLSRPAARPARRASPPAAPPRPTAAPTPTAPRPAPPAAARNPDVEAFREEILRMRQGLGSLDHFELLGIARSATPAEVKAAYFKQARRFHPDVHEPGVVDLKDSLAAILMRLGEAYEVLSRAHTRASYESRLPRPSPGAGSTAPRPAPASPSAAEPEDAPDPIAEALFAEDALRRAERLVDGARCGDAIQLLQGWLPRIPGRVMRDKAQILLARAHLANPTWVRRGEEILLGVVQESPGNAQAPFLLGELYEERGLKTRAEAMFRRALELDPGHHEAAARLKALAPPALLKKIFGKP